MPLRVDDAANMTGAGVGLGVRPTAEGLALQGAGVGVTADVMGASEGLRRG